MYLGLRAFALAFLLLTLLHTTVGALTRVDVGGGIGVDFSRISSDDYLGLESKPGVRIDGTLELGLSERLSVSTGVGFSQKGGRSAHFYEEVIILPRGTSGVSEITFDFDYLTLPLAAKLGFPLGDGDAAGLRPYLEAGAEIGFLLSAKQTFEYTSPDGSVEYDAKDGSKLIDLSARFSAGLELPLGAATRSFLELGFVTGLTDVREEFPDDGFAHSNWRNETVYLQLGLLRTVGGQLRGVESSERAFPR